MKLRIGYSVHKVCKIYQKMTFMVIVRWNVENPSEDNGLAKTVLMIVGW